MPAMKGLTTALSVNDKIVAGGTSFVHTPTAAPIDVTNKIECEWAEYLPGLKQWTITSQGVYVTDSEGLEALQQAFLDSQEIKVTINLGNKVLTGNAVITSFPINTVYSDSGKYQIQLQGTGALTYA